MIVSPVGLAYGVCGIMALFFIGTTDKTPSIQSRLKACNGANARDAAEMRVRHQDNRTDMLGAVCDRYNRQRQRLSFSFQLPKCRLNAKLPQGEVNCLRSTFDPGSRQPPLQHGLVYVRCDLRSAGVWHGCQIRA